jgi:hypothetical protein
VDVGGGRADEQMSRGPESLRKKRLSNAAAQGHNVFAPLRVKLSLAIVAVV